MGKRTTFAVSVGNSMIGVNPSMGKGQRDKLKFFGTGKLIRSTFISISTQKTVYILKWECSYAHMRKQQQNPGFKTKMLLASRQKPEPKETAHLSPAI